MAERKIDGTFTAVPGGYSQKIDDRTTLFVPSFCVSSFNEDTGELYGYTPDYEAIEANKMPAIQADNPGVYSYCYEMEKAPIGCDFSAELSYYGNHYFLRPIKPGLAKLHGRGITYNEKDNDYKVTLKAFEKLKEQYRIKLEYCLD